MDEVYKMIFATMEKYKIEEITKLLDENIMASTLSICSIIDDAEDIFDLTLSDLKDISSEIRACKLLKETAEKYKNG